MTPEIFISQLTSQLACQASSQQSSESISKSGTTKPIDFEDTMAVINDHFHYVPTAFTNGVSDISVSNEAGQNEGSCKIFAFAQILQLSEEQTLGCFGRFYQDVINTPDGNDHANIRNFMRDGWKGIHFEGQALKRK
ncbi:HopJ type III effector protein [Neptunomonas sp.]|uniref:HopJ type III effector protein n=1 Tax=Neptunomonas sp. TaxID=1971898 RepID=UPI00356A8299